MIPEWLQLHLGLNQGYVTMAVLGFCAILLITWDIVVKLDAPPEQHATISERIASMATKHPLLPFAAGVLVGHFFWVQVVCTKGCIP